MTAHSGRPVLQSWKEDSKDCRLRRTLRHGPPQQRRLAGASIEANEPALRPHRVSLPHDVLGVPSLASLPYKPNQYACLQLPNSPGAHRMSLAYE